MTDRPTDELPPPTLPTPSSVPVLPTPAAATADRFTEAQLVTDGFLRRESDTYDIIDDQVVSLPGGSCA